MGTITIQHGFKTIEIDLDTEPKKSLEALLKKYKDNLFISVATNTLLVTEANTNLTVDITNDVSDGSFYVINLRHDAKG